MNHDRMLASATGVLTLLLTLALTTGLVAQKDCNRTSTGLVPLIDMGTARYKTYPGGLYPGGNTPPPAHAAGGAAAVQAIRPLAANGQPDPAGKIVLVSIGMSNTTQEFAEFVRISDADPKRNKAVAVVDLAQGGMDARKVADPNHTFWTTALARLRNANLTAAQVQVAWVKEAIARPTRTFPNNAIELRDLLGQIARNLRIKFPNIRICYVSSRIYAGYAGTTLNPEPYAYEGGFATRWLIEQQIHGDKALNHDAAKGPVVAPWLAWGPYLWADGLNKRSDGLTWECADFANDGTHPATSGRRKVAQLLNDHFTTDVTARPWYGGTPGGGGGLAAMRSYGQACASSVGPLTIRWNSLPQLGNANFAIGVTQARAGTLALFFFSLGSANLPIQGCALYVDTARLFHVVQTSIGTGGNAILHFAIPNDTTLIGAKAYAQWVNQDSRATNLQLIGGGAATAGAELLLGR